MPIADALLNELDHEMKTTRAMLERIPDSSADWKPHARSMTMGQLATHLPSLLAWIPQIVGAPELDLAGPPTEQNKLRWQSAAATVAGFDDALAAGRSAIAAASDAELMVPWTLRAGDHVIVTLPRAGALRILVLNHLIHHRGQLSVYLRLNDIPLPDIYGPTADSVT